MQQDLAEQMQDNYLVMNLSSITAFPEESGYPKKPIVTPNLLQAKSCSTIVPHMGKGSREGEQKVHLKMSCWVAIHCSSTFRGASRGDASGAPAWSMLMSPTHAAAYASRAARPNVRAHTCFFTSAACRVSEYLQPTRVCMMLSLLQQHDAADCDKKLIRMLIVCNSVQALATAFGNLPAFPVFSIYQS